MASLSRKTDIHLRELLTIFKIIWFVTKFVRKEWQLMTKLYFFAINSDC